MNTEIEIHKAQFEDAAIIADGWSRSIREICASAYNNDPVLIEAWTSGKTPANIRQIINEDDVAIVAVMNGQILGVGCAKFQLEKFACYVWPEYIGLGAGSAILKYIEKCAHQKGIEIFRIHASLNAVGFYQKMGYKATGQVLYENNIASIHMEKQLNAKPAYFLVQIQEVFDKNTYMEYVRQVPAIIKKFNGRYLSRGEAESISGNNLSVRTILIEFPSEDHIKKWWSSPQYREIALLRESSAKAHAYILQACQL